MASRLHVRPVERPRPVRSDALQPAIARADLAERRAARSPPPEGGARGRYSRADERLRPAAEPRGRRRSARPAARASARSTRPGGGLLGRLRQALDGMPGRMRRAGFGSARAWSRRVRRMRPRVPRVRAGMLPVATSRRARCSGRQRTADSFGVGARDRNDGCETTRSTGQARRGGWPSGPARELRGGRGRNKKIIRSGSRRTGLSTSSVRLWRYIGRLGRGCSRIGLRSVATVTSYD